jgi:hypothetical protein
MKLVIVALFGLFAGGVLAVGSLPADGLSTAGTGLLALIGAHWLTLLPWLLAALFARLWWRQKKIAGDWESFGRMNMAASKRLRALEMAAHEEAAARRRHRQNGKRATR